MDAQRSSYGVAERTLLNLVMLREYFYPLGQTRSFYWHFQLLRQVVDISAALSGQQWNGHENPKMAAPLAHFEGRLDAILSELILELDQVMHRVGVVRINGNPLTALIDGVDGV